jgi:hypothetical protein
MADEDLIARIRIIAEDEASDVMRRLGSNVEETAKSFSRLLQLSKWQTVALSNHQLGAVRNDHIGDIGVN